MLENEVTLKPKFLHFELVTTTSSVVSALEMNMFAFPPPFSWSELIDRPALNFINVTNHQIYDSVINKMKRQR